MRRLFLMIVFLVCLFVAPAAVNTATINAQVPANSYRSIMSTLHGLDVRIGKIGVYIVYESA